MQMQGFCFIETDMPLLPPISIGGLGLLEVDLCLGIIAVAFSTLQTVKTSMPCMCSSQKPEKLLDPLELESQAVVNCPCGYCKLNLGPLEDQLMLLTAKPAAIQLSRSLKSFF